MKKLKIVVLLFFWMLTDLWSVHSQDLVDAVTEVKEGKRTAMNVVEFIGKKFESGDADKDFAKNAADYVCYGRIKSGDNYLPGNKYYVGPKVADLGGIEIYFKTFLAAANSKYGNSFLKKIVLNYADRENVADELVKKHLKGVLVYAEVARLGMENFKAILTHYQTGLDAKVVLERWGLIGFAPDKVKKNWETEKFIRETKEWVFVTQNTWKQLIAVNQFLNETRSSIDIQDMVNHFNTNRSRNKQREEERRRQEENHRKQQEQLISEESCRDALRKIGLDVTDIDLAISSFRINNPYKYNKFVSFPYDGALRNAKTKEETLEIEQAKKLIDEYIKQKKHKPRN